MPELHLVGIFHIQDSLEPSQQTIELIEQIKPFHEAPLVLLAQLDQIGQSLPVTIYESVFDTNHMKFRQVKVLIDTEESERIAINDLKREPSSDRSVLLRNHLVSQIRALGSFEAQLQVLLDYVSQVNNDTRKPDYNLLKSLYATLQRITKPASDENCNDELLSMDAALLSTISSGLKTSIDNTSVKSLLNNVSRRPSLDSRLQIHQQDPTSDDERMVPFLVSR